MIALLWPARPENTMPRNSTCTKPPPCAVPPNKVAAALTGIGLDTLAAGAASARGGGTSHCSAQYASDAQKAKNSKELTSIGSRFI